MGKWSNRARSALVLMAENEILTVHEPKYVGAKMHRYCEMVKFAFSVKTEKGFLGQIRYSVAHTFKLLF